MRVLCERCGRKTATKPVSGEQWLTVQPKVERYIVHMAFNVRTEGNESNPTLCLNCHRDVITIGLTALHRAQAHLNPADKPEPGADESSEKERVRRSIDTAAAERIDEATQEISPALAIASTAHCRLEMRTNDLILALSALVAAEKGGRTVRLVFRDGELDFERGDTRVRVPARGTWPVPAATNGTRFLRDLLSRLRRKGIPESIVLVGTHSHV